MSTKTPRSPQALVTGASRGLGAAFATELQAMGYRVVGTSRRGGPAAATLPLRSLDLSGGEVEAFIGENESLLREVDVLVNNAGSGVFGRMETFSESDWAGQMDLLFHGPVRLCRAVLPHMRERGRGCLVNVSSLAAEFPLPFLSAYSTAKAALSQFSIALMEELRGTGVRVIDLRPGDFRTGFNEAVRRLDSGDPRLERVWMALEHHLRAAPPPEKAARDLARILRNGRSGTFRTGSFTQARLAPFARRLLGETWMRLIVRRYYGLNRRGP